MALDASVVSERFAHLDGPCARRSTNLRRNRAVCAVVRAWQSCRLGPRGSRRSHWPCRSSAAEVRDTMTATASTSAIAIRVHRSHRATYPRGSTPRRDASCGVSGRRSLDPSGVSMGFVRSIGAFPSVHRNRVRRLDAGCTGRRVERRRGARGVLRCGQHRFARRVGVGRIGVGRVAPSRVPGTAARSGHFVYVPGERTRARLLLLPAE